MTRRKTDRNSVWLFCVMVSFWLNAAPALAQSETDGTEDGGVYSDLWTGAFTGVGAYAGAGFLSNPEIHDSLGWAFGVKGRVSLLLELADLQLSYTFTTMDGSLEDASFAMSNHSLAASINVHPLFIASLLGKGVGYILSTIYIELGWSLEFSSIDWGLVQLDEPGEIGYHVGAGFDVPLDEVDDGEAFWLGFYYRNNRIPTALEGIEDEDGCLRQHFFMIRIAFRDNGLLF